MELPAITIDDYELDVVEQFTYLGSTITDNLSLDTEIDRRIGKAATTLARLTSRVWTNPRLTVETKMVIYNACVVSTLMYSSETWTTYARQEKRLNSFHLRSICRIQGISWQDRVSNTEVLTQAYLLSMFTLLKQRRLFWLGHVYRMEVGHIPKCILYGELAYGRKRPAERSARTPTDQRPHTNATFAAEIVSPTSVSTATSDAAAVEVTGQPGCTPMIKLDRRRPL